MKTWLHSLRQKLHHYRVAIGVTAIVLVVAIALIIAGYWFDWTGFNGYNKVSITHIISGTNNGTTTTTEEYQPGKALWDWLQLLIIPLVLAIAALLFNLANTRTEQNIAAKRYKQDQEIALDKQREDLLQTYLDRMSELLLKEKLRSSVVDAEVRNVARVRTITILFQLDARRIGYVFAFLRESRLMSTKLNGSIVSLNQADLQEINLSGANLREADLREANLFLANFIEANLFLANLSGASLFLAKLFQADLREANLSGANLIQANLRNADLREANLSGANLLLANLSGASLSGANLSGANLKGARGITIEELEKKAKTLQDAIMPDGTKHS